MGVVSDDCGFLTFSASQGSETNFQTAKASCYFAPEVFDGQEFNEKCALWSLGVVLFEMHSKLDTPYFSEHKEPTTQESPTDLVRHKPIDFNLIHCHMAKGLVGSVSSGPDC